MSEAEIAASGVVGIVLPVAVSLVKSVSWGRPAKIALTAGLSLILALIVNLIASGFSLQFLADWGVIFGTASTVYTAILEKSGLETRLRDKLPGRTGE